MPGIFCSACASSSTCTSISARYGCSPPTPHGCAATTVASPSSFFGRTRRASTPAGAGVDALRVLAKNDEVDATIVTAQRCEFGVEQPYRAEIDVQVELEAQAEQNIPGMLVPGDSRVADRPEEDRVYVVAQVAERRLRERLARREVVIGAVGKALEVESEAVLRGGLLDRPERRRDDLGADAVSRDHGDAMVVFHSKPVARPQLTQ